MKKPKISRIGTLGINGDVHDKKCQEENGHFPIKKM
jgi:hypothetical protein